MKIIEIKKQLPYYPLSKPPTKLKEFWSLAFLVFLLFFSKNNLSKHNLRNFFYFVKLTIQTLFDPKFMRLKIFVLIDSIMFMQSCIYNLLSKISSFSWSWRVSINSLCPWSILLFYSLLQVLLYFLMGSVISWLSKKIWCNQIIQSIFSIIQVNLLNFSKRNHFTN